MSIANLEVPNFYNLFANTVSLVQGLILNGGQALQKYLENNYGTLVSGPFTSGVLLARFRQIGKVCFIEMPTVSGTSTAATIFTFSVLIPQAPSQNLFFPIDITDNGTASVGTLNISNTGLMTISVGFNSNFTGAGTAGFNAFSVSYCTDV
jgi:hypothetical protein